MKSKFESIDYQIEKIRRNISIQLPRHQINPKQKKS